MSRFIALVLTGLSGVAFAVHAVLAQGVPTPHPPMHGGGSATAEHGSPVQNPAMRPASGAPVPAMPGQDAFAAIAEIVRLLEADPDTDWSKVDFERLRQHLVDMNEVVLRSEVAQVPVPGGLAMEITGTGRTAQAIGAMVVPHAAELDHMPSFTAKTETIPGGVRLTVVAKQPDAAAVVARIRGLGFAGLITEGAHHQAHHLAMARGEALGHSHSH